MPIYANETDGSTVVHLGQGDLIVGRDKAGDEILFIFDEVHRGEIGADAKVYEGVSTDKIQGKIVRLVFDNEASVDVVLDCLLRVKSKLGTDTILASMEANAD